MSNSVLRKHWGFDGVIESDCGALSHILDQHKYVKDKLHAAAASMNGTCDVECDSVYSGSLLTAHTAGLVTQTQLAAAARRIMTHRFKLGLFSDPRGTKYFGGKYNQSTSVHSDEHAAIAREAAQQGVVVVQNDPSGSTSASGQPTPILPLSTARVKSIALIGPMGDITDPFLGDYRPAACPGPAKSAPEGTACLPTLRQLLAKRAPAVTLHVANGCGNGSASVPCDTPTSPVTPAVTAAMAASEIIILAIGEKVTDNDHAGNTGGEGHDRSTIGLPGRQAELVFAAIASKKPVIAVILSGGSVSVDALKTAASASASGGSPVAVVYAGFGGETGQNAIVDVLFGDAPASGRLPFTVYPESCEYRSSSALLSILLPSLRSTGPATCRQVTVLYA
eukprot:COSAG06_NODE_2348_length_7031_cov_4.658973_3_plen_394_part_00